MKNLILILTLYRVCNEAKSKLTKPMPQSRTSLGKQTLETALISPLSLSSPGNGLGVLGNSKRNRIISAI